MMRERSNEPNERLVDWLRQNDPGAERPLDAEERLETRRQMLVQLGARRRVVAWRWAWGLAGAAALVAGVGLYRSGVEQVGKDTVRNQATSNVTTAPTSDDEAVRGRAIAESDTPRVADVPGEQRIPEQDDLERDAPTKVARTEEPVQLPTLRDDTGAPTRPVELRFVAPGGTQLVWTLDPEFEITAPKDERKGQRG